MKKKKHIVTKTNKSAELFSQPLFRKDVPVLTIENYLWMNNNYEPKTEVKICYSDDFLFLFFEAFEKEIRATYTEINSPVYKDSCVEFFFNPFPELTEKYFNFEINPLGTMLCEFGRLRERTFLSVDEIREIEIVASVTAPVKGFHGSDSWKIFCKIPTALFEKYYRKKISFGKASGNFYKCGDETKFKHYGAWNKIVSRKPDFHLPEIFGELIFGK
ncbi:MAG: hypothetical protein GXO87_06405 [Chlorobi bacterium]|nr:hypothetical protein [Chlorobiota bacterium]